MEYHSFLLAVEMLQGLNSIRKFPSPYRVIFILTNMTVLHLTEIFINFRLLTEYHSFLFKLGLVKGRHDIPGFPSPYGVSFILINKV